MTNDNFPLLFDSVVLVVEYFGLGNRQRRVSASSNETPCLERLDLLSCDPFRTLSSFLREHTNTITTVFHIALSKDKTGAVLFPNRGCTVKRKVAGRNSKLKMTTNTKTSTVDLPERYPEITEPERHWSGRAGTVTQSLFRARDPETYCTNSKDSNYYLKAPSLESPAFNLAWRSL